MNGSVLALISTAHFYNSFVYQNASMYYLIASHSYIIYINGQKNPYNQDSQRGVGGPRSTRGLQTAFEH